MHKHHNMWSTSSSRSCVRRLSRTSKTAQHDDVAAGRNSKRRHRNGLALLVVPYLLLGPWLQRHGVLAGWRGRGVATVGETLQNCCASFFLV